MATNIVCSDTYIDAFSRLDKKVPTPKPLANISFGLFSRIFYFLAGIIAGIIIMNFI